MQKLLAFDIAEYQKRLSNLQALIQDDGLDGMLINTPENLTYLTGYHTTGYYVYQGIVVPARGKPVMVTRYFEAENVRRYSWIDDCATVTDNDDPIAVTLDVFNALSLTGKRIGLELDCWFLTNKHAAALRERAGGTQFVDASGTVEQLRLIKSPAEVDKIRQACRMAEAGVNAGLAAIAPGVSEDHVAAKVVEALISRGCEYWGAPPYVCAGPRTAIPHATWGGRILEKGDVVYFEIPGTLNRYSGVLMRTAIIGPPTDTQKRLAEASIAGLEAAIETIGPGVPSCEVDRACRGRVIEAGFGAGFKHRTGYSIGINFPPDWGEGHIFSLKASETRPLEAGMTFHLVPLVFHGDEFGIGFSETVLVTETGCEILTDFTRRFIEV